MACTTKWLADPLSSAGHASACHTATGTTRSKMTAGGPCYINSASPNASLPCGERIIPKLCHLSATLVAEYKYSMPTPGSKIRCNSLQKRLLSAKAELVKKKETSAPSSLTSSSHPSSSSSKTVSKRPRAASAGSINKSVAAGAAAAAAAAAATTPMSTMMEAPAPAPAMPPPLETIINEKPKAKKMEPMRDIAAEVIPMPQTAKVTPVPLNNMAREVPAENKARDEEAVTAMKKETKGQEAKEKANTVDVVALSEPIPPVASKKRAPLVANMIEERRSLREEGNTVEKIDETVTIAEAAKEAAIPIGGRFTLGIPGNEIVKAEDSWSAQCLRIMEAFRGSYLIQQQHRIQPLSPWFWVPELMSGSVSTEYAAFISPRKPLFFSHIVAKLTDQKYPYSGTEAFVKDVHLVLYDSMRFFERKNNEDVVHQAREMQRLFETVLKDVKKEPLRSLNSYERADLVSYYGALTEGQQDKILDFVRADLGGDDNEDVKLEILNLSPQRQWELLTLIKQEYEKIATIKVPTNQRVESHVMENTPAAKRQRVDQPTNPIHPMHQLQYQNQKKWSCYAAHQASKSTPQSKENNSQKMNFIRAPSTRSTRCSSITSGSDGVSMPKTPANGFSMLDEAEEILDALDHDDNIFESPLGNSSTDVPGSSSASSFDFPTSSPEFPYSPLDVAHASVVAGGVPTHGNPQAGVYSQAAAAAAAGGKSMETPPITSFYPYWAAIAPSFAATPSWGSQASWDAWWADDSWAGYGGYYPAAPASSFFPTATNNTDASYNGFPAVTAANAFYNQAPFAAEDASDAQFTGITTSS